MRIPQESIDYIVAHAGDRPLCNVARRVGVSVSTMYAVLHKYCGIPKRKGRPANYAARDIVAAEYPTSSSGEIAARHHFNKSLVISWARRLGLRHTPETQERLHRKVQAACIEGRKAKYKQIRAAWLRARRMDELRLLSGQKQQTRFRISLVPIRTQKAISNLVCKYNYFRDVDIGGPYCIYYDDQTSRTPMEHLYVRRYGLKFVQA